MEKYKKLKRVEGDIEDLKTSEAKYSFSMVD